MSVVTTTSSISYNGNNSTTVFAYNFRILAESDLVVKVGGVVKTLTTHYTVSGVGAASGGNVTFTAGNTPPTGTKNVAFTRSVTNTQATDYQDGDKLSADVIEADFDRRTMQSQEIENELNSVVLKVPVEHTAASFSGLLPDPGLAASRSKVININAAGTGLELSVLTLGTLAPQNANAVDIDGGAIDGTVIGGSSAAAGTFTTLTASTLGGALNVNNENLTNVDIDSGAIDGTTIGGASAAAGTFTTATATTKVVTPEVEMSGSTLLVDAASGTLDMNATTLDVDATTTCEIDNSNTTNGVKLGTNTSSGKVYIGHTTSETTVNDNLTVTGDLIVNGTTTTVNSTTITVDDKNIEIGSVASPSDSTADGGGITLKGASDKTLLWDNANDNWTSNQHLNISSGKSFKINNVDVLNAGSLGANVTNSSLTSVGSLGSLTVTGATELQGNVTIGNAASDSITVHGTLETATPIIFEGGTANSHETTLGITDPTADRTITLPDETGTVITTASTVAVAGGGTGQTSWTDGQLAIGVSSGNTLAKGTLTAGTGISVTNAGGSITIANTGNAAQADMNGSELIFDADGDTSITADSDDQLDIKIAGADDFQFTANTFTVLSGSTLTIASGATIANSGTATGFTATSLSDANNDTKIQVEESADENKIRFDTAGSERMIIAADGSVGIGTSSPTRQLELKGSSENAPLVIDTASGTHAGVWFKENAADRWQIYSEASSGDLAFFNYGSGNESLRIEANGEVNVKESDIVFGTAGKGICLGVTSNTDANTLDDFEEGTWTGTLEGTTTDPTATITATGHYCKIGTFVHIAINFGTHDTSGAVGMPFISGLPHMPLGATGGFPTGNCMTYGSRYSWSGQIVPYIVNTYIMFYQTVSAGNWGGSSFGTTGSGAQLFVTGEYRSSS